MADDRPLHERLLEIALFAPVGIAVAVAEELPALADKGREQLTKHFQIARMVGKFTFAEATRRVGAAPKTRSQPAPHPAPAKAPAPAETTPKAAAEPVVEPPRATRRPVVAERPTPPPPPAVEEEVVATEPLPAVDELAIPGYDTLAASQVVQRLGSLRPAELEAVRRYEEATRGRRTILHRIEQLGSSDGRASA